MATIFGTRFADGIDTSSGVTDGDDSVFGYEGDDVLFGRGGNDILNGGDGNDILKGGAGADHLDGAAGNSDWADYYNSARGVLVSLETGRGVGGTAHGDTLVDIENLSGSAHGDILTGNAGANYLNGYHGNDGLWGGGGADTLDGGDGNDLLVGGSGADVLHGRSGTDTASYAGSGEGVVVSLRRGTGSFGDAEGDTLISIENLTGSSHGDGLFGDDNANVLNGGGGNDLLLGFGGNDTLTGGMGTDAMTGGIGADTFVWQSIRETGATRWTADVVTDFDRKAGDLLRVSGIDADGNAANGDTAFSFLGHAASNPFTAAGQISWYGDGTDTYIMFNTDADAGVEAMVRLAGVHTIDASWFAL